MPSEFLFLDTQFPTFNEGESTTKKLDKVMNHLYQLQENLRYVLRNLDASNFNEAGLREITEPLRISLQDEMGSFEMNIDTSGIQAQIKDLESQLQLKVSASLFETTIANQNGQISQMQQTVDGISLTVAQQQETIDGYSSQISQIQQQSDSITLTVAQQQETIDGYSSKISQLEISIDGISLSAVSKPDPSGESDALVFLELYNGDGHADLVNLTMGAIDGDGGGSIIQLGLDGIQIQTDEIVIAGAVRFIDLEEPNEYTIINGGNIKTGEITAVNFVSEGRGWSDEELEAEGEPLPTTLTVRFRPWEGYDGYADLGGIRYRYIENDELLIDGEWCDFGEKLYLYTKMYDWYGQLSFPSIKVESAGRVSIEAPNETHGYVYIEGTGDGYGAAGDETGVTIRAPYSAVRIQSGNDVWTFDGGNLLLNGSVILKEELR